MKTHQILSLVSAALLSTILQARALAAPPTPVSTAGAIRVAEASADQKEKGPTFSGNASWYGIPFHGKKTASGEIFDMNKLSAAHKTLPFPTKVMVENPKNGQACVIRVTDRGPFVHGRVLDLSREAAKRVGIFPGVGYVEATVLNSKTAQDKK